MKRLCVFDVVVVSGKTPGQPLGRIFDALRNVGMGTEKERLFVTFCLNFLLQVIKQFQCFSSIIVCFGHQVKPDEIGFGFQLTGVAGNRRHGARKAQNSCNLLNH